MSKGRCEVGRGWRSRRLGKVSARPGPEGLQSELGRTLHISEKDRKPKTETPKRFADTAQEDPNAISLRKGDCGNAK